MQGSGPESMSSVTDSLEKSSNDGVPILVFLLGIWAFIVCMSEDEVFLFV